MRLPRRACRAALSALAALATALSAPAAPAQERRVELVFAPELLNRIATDNLGEHTDEITRRILGLSPGIEAVRLTRASGRVTLAVTPRAQDDLRPTFRFTVDKMLYYRMNTARGDITGMTEALQEARAAEPLLRAIAYRSDERYAVVEFTLDLRAAYEARSRERAEEQERARAAAQRAGADAGARTAAEAKPAPATAPQRAEPLPAATRGDAPAPSPPAPAPPPSSYLPAVRLGGEAPPVVDGDGGDAAWRVAAPFAVELQGASGRFSATVAAVWDADRIWFLLRWPDRDRSDRHRPWVWSPGERAYLAGREIEDALALGFAREGRLGDCMLSGGESTLDLWTWRAARTDPVGHAEDGTLTLSSSRITRANSYQARNGRTVWIKEAPDDGTPPYQSQVAGAFAGERIPRYVPRTPGGSAADVAGKGLWKDGFWTVELSRRLAAGDGEDVDFAPGRDVWFSVAVFDKREGTDHSASKELTLRLEER